MKNLITIIFLSVNILCFSQDRGTVRGTVTDKEMGGESLPFANVFIKGTSTGGTSDMDGTYTISVPAGNHILVFSFVGYETVEKPITVVGGETLTVNQELGANQGVQLQEVEIQATTSKEKESALLLDQKKAVAIQTKIGAQELAKKGVGDVATAVTKTTGVSKQEGTGSIFVRGLGDRYNVSTLNGLPLPSNDPSRKNIDLGIFSTDIVEFIGIDKTFNVKNYGDFGGANVNISSKVYQGKGFAEISLSSGLNTVANSKRDFYVADGPGQFGFYKSKYPDYVLRNNNFTTSWDRTEGNAPVNSSITLKGGDSFKLTDNTKLSFFAVGSFDNEYTYKEGPARGDVTVSGITRKDFTRESYSYDTKSSLMGNLRLKYKRNVFKYNGLFVNNSTTSHDDFQGILDAFDNAAEGGAVVQRQTYLRNTLFVHQLLGEHKLGEQFEVNWGGAFNFNKNRVPDRRQSTVLPSSNADPNSPKSMALISNQSDNHRFFSDLEEEEVSANIGLTYKFAKNEDEEYNAKLTLGYSGRFKDVDFDATQFNFDINTRVEQPIITDVYNLDSYFNQENFDAGLYAIRTFRGGLGTSSVNVLLPQTFGGFQNINAGFLSLEYKLNENFTALLGVRAEQINQFIEFNTSIRVGDNDLDKLAVLPSLYLKYALNEQHNVKFAASKTYTLPQFKERAEFLFEGVVNTSLGNSKLYASDNYNVDLKWEYFPEKEEIISFGVFGKYIENPINEIGINSASNDISYANTGDWGYAFGGELEVKKTVFNHEKETEDATLNNKLSFGVNAAYMVHNQELNTEKVKEETDFAVNFSVEEDGFAGASDVLLNSDFTYLKDFSDTMNIQGSVVFNYFSDRIQALGTTGATGGVNKKGNLVDKGFGTLDVVLKSAINKNLSFGLSAKNLLNPTIETVQDIQDVTVSAYKRGVTIKASLSYRF